MTSAQFWRGGDRVEVERVVDGGATVYFPATVVNAPSVRKNLVWVEHESLMDDVGSVRRKEYVNPTRLHPSMPRELDRRFEAGDEVDFFKNSEGCWLRGRVKKTVVEDSSYIVKFNGENRPEAKVDNFNLRLHRDWEDGVWVTSLLQQGNVLTKRVKLKIKLRRRYQYEKGDVVEVRSEEGEEAYKGSWYCGRVLSVIGDDRYIVEHLRFQRNVDESMIRLRVLVESKNMRPVPPLPEHDENKGYEPGDEVDAWFNKRWWIGRVSKVLHGGSKYLVYFVSTGEEPIVPDFNLRPHKEWINGQWIKPKSCDRAEKVLNNGMEVRSSKRGYMLQEECGKPPLKKLKPCDRAEDVFNNGMMVEVRSDEQGYEGSWYSAKIISYLGENRYIVEYQTLKTDDERELLKEEASVSDIRPTPPPPTPLILKAC